MIELRGYMALPTQVIDKEDHLVFDRKAMATLFDRVEQVTDGRVDFSNQYKHHEVRVYFLADFRKRGNEPIEAVKELQSLLSPMEEQFFGQAKVDIFAHNLDTDERIVFKLGDPEREMS